MSEADAPGRQASRGARLNVLARLAGAAMAFGLQLLLARLLPPQEFGLLVLAMTWLAVGGALGCLSMPMVAVRFVAEHLAVGELALARGALRFAFVTAAAATGVLALLLAAAPVWGLPLPLALPSADVLVLAALLWVSTLLLVLCAWLQGLHCVATAELLSGVLRSTLLIGLVLAVLGSGAHAATASQVLQLHLVAALATLGCAWHVARRAVPAGWHQTQPQAQATRWRHAAAGLYGTMVVAAVAERVDMLAMGWSGSPEQVAEYAVATRFSQSVWLLVTAVHAATAPRISAHLAQQQAGAAGALGDVVAGPARLALLLAAGASLLFLVAGPWLLGLFGAAYGAAWPALLLLGGGLTVAALFGPALLVATMAGAAKLAMGCIAAGAVCNGLLNLWLVPHWGATGAGLAAASGMSLAAMSAWWLTRRHLGVDTLVLQARRRDAPTH